jgi:hypothetical protein
MNHLASFTRAVSNDLLYLGITRRATIKTMFEHYDPLVFNQGEVMRYDIDPPRPGTALREAIWLASRVCWHRRA